MDILRTYYRKSKEKIVSRIPAGIRRTFCDYKDILCFLFLLFLSQIIYELAYNPVRNNIPEQIARTSANDGVVSAPSRPVRQIEERKTVPVIHLLKRYTGPLFDIKNNFERLEGTMFAGGAYYLGRCLPGYGEIRWEGRSVTYPEDKVFTKLYINDSCNGNKIYYQFLFILLFYWGPWRKKCWYIPLGVLTLVAVNVLRMSFLYYIGGEFPAHFDFWHEQGGRAIMYPSIFLLWLCWELKVNLPYQLAKRK